MGKILYLVLCTLLLGGCTAGPIATPETAAPATGQTAVQATPESATPEQAVTEALGAVKTRRLTAALNGCIAYEVDSAGGSLKTAIAAAGMVEYLAGDFVPRDLAGETLTWQAALHEEDRATMDANWPGVYRCAQEICADPASQRELLDDAGVTTDFSAMDLTEVPAQLDTMNTALTG